MGEIIHVGLVNSINAAHTDHPSVVAILEVVDERVIGPSVLPDWSATALPIEGPVKVILPVYSRLEDSTGDDQFHAVIISTCKPI